VAERSEAPVFRLSGAPLRYAPATLLGLLLLGWIAVGPAIAGDRVVLRQTKSDKKLPARFYQVKEGHPLRPKVFFPTEKDTFELLVASTVAGARGNSDSDVGLHLFRDSFGRVLVPQQPVVVYDFDEVPSSICGALSLAMRAIAMAQLNGKPYDKTRVKKKEKHVKLPAPTLRDWKRKKQHRILATEEEYRIRAELAGPPVIRVTNMPYLKEYDRPERGVLLLVVEAELPVTGRVHYKVPNVLNVSTGYRTRMALHLVVQVRTEREGNKLHLRAPEVLRIDVRLRDLDLSNDLFNVARKPIRDFINEEARRKHQRICREANKAIRKAVDDQTFRLPLLRYLMP